MKQFLPLTLILLTSCASLADAPAPNATTTQVPFITSQPVSNGSVAADWWTQFGSAELNSLISQAMTYNTDILAAAERVEQARLSARITAANAAPTFNATAGAGRTLTETKGDTSGHNNLNAGASVAYEVDLFGRLAALRKSAKRNYEATTYDTAALTNLTRVTVAQTYFQVLAFNERLALAEENLKLAEEVMRLLDVRFKAGVISGLEVAQQRTSLAGTRASIATLRQQRAEALTTLGVLVGTAPQGMVISGASLAGLTIPLVPVNQPSAVVMARPDVAAAESRLQAAGADITAARAALFPAITLGAGATFAFDPASNAISLSSNLLAPIFRGGSLRNQLTLTKSRREELLATYQGIVLAALKEAQDALTATATSGERLIQNGTAREEAAKAYAISRTRLANGIIDMPTLLAAQQADLAATDALAQSRLEQLNAATNLILALGGGWQYR